MKCVFLFATPQVDTITLFMDEDIKVGEYARLVTPDTGAARLIALLLG